MKLGNSFYLGLLWIVPLLIAFYVWAFKKKRVLIEEFVSPDLRDRLLPTFSLSRQRLKAGLMVLGVLFLILSLSQPRWGFHWEEVNRRGVDIMIALDVSKSMLAEDVSPNRLERAKRKIGDFLKIVQGDRLGLIAFAGTSFLQCPLTLDHGAVQIFLDYVDTDLIPVPGTAISQAIDVSVESLEKSERNSRALILITDGEDTVGDPLIAAKKASEKGIKIYTIGIGKEGGAPIPNAGGGFKKDRSGNVIMTRMNETVLQKVALETGGSYVRSVTGDLDLDQIYSDIRKNTESTELSSGRQKRFEERFQWPLILALLCFVLESLLTERKQPFRLSWRFKFLKRAVAGLVILILSSNVMASGESRGIKYYNQQKYQDSLKELLAAQVENPQSIAHQYNSGNAYYKLNQFQEAASLFEGVAKSGDHPLSQKGYYNLGNTHFRMGKLQEALTDYQKAIELDPKDTDSKHNLEFVQKEIRRRIEENKKNPQKNQSQNSDPKNEKGGEKKDQEKGNEAAEQPQNKGSKAADSKEEKKGGGNETAKLGENGEKASEMSPEEAKEWLSTLKEADRNKFLNKNASGRRQYEVEKDW